MDIRNGYENIRELRVFEMGFESWVEEFVAGSKKLLHLRMVGIFLSPFWRNNNGNNGQLSFY